MKTTRAKQKWYVSLVIITLLSAPWWSVLASTPRAIPAGSLAPAVNPAILKTSEEWLNNPVLNLLNQFKDELHQLSVKEYGSPFGCLANVPASVEYKDNTQYTIKGTDYRPTVENEIVEDFSNHLDDVEKEDFSGFDQDLEQLLKNPDYWCFQDPFYFNPAYDQVKDLARKVIAQWKSDQNPTNSSSNTGGGTSPSGPSTPPSTGSSNPATPSAPSTTPPAAPSVPTSPSVVGDTAAAEPLKDSQASSATQATLTEEPVTLPSPMVSGGACSLSLSTPAQGLSWSYLGYLLMLFPVGMIRAVRARIVGGQKK